MRKPKVFQRPKNPPPQPHEIEQSIRAILWLLCGGFAGQLVQTLPHYTILWSLGGVLVLLVLSHSRYRFKGNWSPLPWVLALPLAIFCGWKAYREYTGADYHLNYRVCGKPISTYGGYIDSVAFGIEFVNPNKVDLYISPQSQSLTAEDRRSTIAPPPGAGPYTVHPSNLDDENDSKVTDFVNFDPPLSVKNLHGTAHYEFKFGPRKDGPLQTLVIDGTYEILFGQDFANAAFHFSPGDKTSPGNVGMCDINQQLNGDDF